tara:strand:+ start:286 stop:666 length:381 start_codon:yes stop_codon:yes gene_type:complete
MRERANEKIVRDIEHMEWKVKRREEREKQEQEYKNREAERERKRQERESASKKEWDAKKKQVQTTEAREDISKPSSFSRSSHHRSGDNFSQLQIVFCCQDYATKSLFEKVLRMCFPVAPSPHPRKL